MILFDFFKKKEKLEPFDLGKLKVDMHSHLIPGIDDGSKDMNQTIAMLSKFQDLGYKKVITTPHVKMDIYPNTNEIILLGLENVRAEIKKVGLKIEIEAAAEYFFDESIMTKIEEKQLLTFGDNYVLVEFSFHLRPQYIDKLFFELQVNGYKPVVAHFERYMYYIGSIEQAKKWRQQGVNIQVNMSSLIGVYGPEVKKQAERLITAKELDFIATDCHQLEQLILLEENLTLPFFHKAAEQLLKNSTL
jgi:protein-tyrosine phosphatase